MSEKRIGDVVTQIKFKKDGILVGFDSGNKVTLSSETFTDFRLYEGKELDETELSAFLAAAFVDRYYVYALRLLSKEAYSEKQVQTKLYGKGADTQTVSIVMEKLKAIDLIDDAAFAESFAKDVGALRLYGKNKILFELHRRGISPKVVATLEFPEKEELEKAFRYASFLNRKYVKSPSEKKATQAIASLISRGFDEAIAEQAVDACIKPADRESELRLLERYFALSQAKYSRKYGGYQLKEKVYLDLRKKGFKNDDIKMMIEKGNIQ